MIYWEECVRQAFDDAEISATDFQVLSVADDVEVAYENYGLSTGMDVADSNFISDETRELEKLKQEIEKRRIWECETEPCESCITTGTIKDEWGRDRVCAECNGEGRVL